MKIRINFENSEKKKKTTLNRVFQENIEITQFSTPFSLSTWRM